MFKYPFTSSLLILLLNLCLGSVSWAANTEASIGEVVFARGVVSSKADDGAIRVLGKLSPLYRQDIITTGPKSFAVIKLTDNSRISIRPNSSLALEKYSIKPAEEGLVMRLFKGGLRTITGLIGKRRPAAYKLNTSVATIGIRGTDFDARLCEGDCSEEETRYLQKTEDGPTVIARVAYLKGSAKAISNQQASRALALGSAIYEGDSLSTQTRSYLVIAFNDRGRMTLKSDTTLLIEKHHYSPARPEKSNAFYRLLKGGVRALTGLISKKKRDNYRIGTSTATIGIRGTGFDLDWLGDCVAAATSCGLNASVWLGAISAQNEAGEFILEQDSAFNIPRIDAAQRPVQPAAPFEVPRPDRLEIDFDELFSSPEGNVPVGLYANTREGIITMERGEQRIEMKAGEAAFAPFATPEMFKLQRARAFQSRDPYLRTINEEFETLYELLDENVIDERRIECVVQ